MPGGRTIVAIHQPNFFPWLGYFNKIALADVFIVLDSVQFQKTGGTWSNRVKMRVRGEPAWITAPVNRDYHGFRSVREMTFAPGEWRSQILHAVHDSYSAAPHFRETETLVTPLIGQGTDLLAAYNLTAIRKLCEPLGIQTSRFVSSSSLTASGKATDLLVALIREVKGTTYLAGGGSAGYQQDEIFRGAGIDVVYQDFKHPVYPQHLKDRPFAPGLSVIDALVNVGLEETATLVRSSRPASLEKMGA